MQDQQIEFHTEQRKASDLKPYDLNPRKMDKAVVASLRKSLDIFGLAEIPVINLDNTIMAGHQRCKILMADGKGNDLIDVRVPNRLLNDDEFKRYLITSNKISGVFDEDMLANHFEKVMLYDCGFSGADLGMADFGIQGDDNKKGAQAGDETPQPKMVICPQCEHEFVPEKKK